MRIIPLKEGDFYEDEVKDFLLINGKQLTTEIQLAVQPFLVMTAEHNTLLDVGLGYNENGEYIIDTILAKEGITPMDIDRIYLSHLHKDHINGLLVETDAGFECRYPNADIYIQRREAEFAIRQQDDISFDYDILEEVLDLANIVWMDADQGILDEHTTYEVVGGHSPYMQVFWMKDGEHIYFYGADNLPKRNYFDFDIAFKSDYDGKRAMQLRQDWKVRAKEEQWIVLFYHDMEMTSYSFEIDR